MFVKRHASQYCSSDLSRMPGLTSHSVVRPSLSISQAVFYNFKFTEASLILCNRDWTGQQELIGFVN